MLPELARSMTVQNDYVQDFDIRWVHHGLSSVSEMPSDPIVEGLYKSKLQNSAQLRTVMALFDQEVVRDNGTPNYQQFTSSRLRTKLRFMFLVR